MRPDVRSTCRLAGIGWIADGDQRRRRFEYLFRNNMKKTL
jgi:hypothetical protein